MGLMRYMAVVETDIGVSRQINQDSILLKHARIENGEVLLAIICDGMGGLKQGEVASAAVVRAFATWFDREIFTESGVPKLEDIACQWLNMLDDLNVRIMEYGKHQGIRLGTTFTGVMFLGDSYLVVHVGDTRVYQLTDSLRQLTTDHTFVAREVACGAMSEAQAGLDPRRNFLLQCVGASECVEPDILFGKTCQGAYLLCSDGFRHEIRSAEIYDTLCPKYLPSQDEMHRKLRFLIERAKERHESDNISAVLIRTLL